MADKALPRDAKVGGKHLWEMEEIAATLLTGDRAAAMKLRDAIDYFQAMLARVKELEQDASPPNPDEMVERVFHAVAPHVAGTDWREVRAAITAALSVKPQSDGAHHEQ